MADVKLEDTIDGTFGTATFATGAATDADSTPTCVVLEQGTAIAYAPTITNKAVGLYNVQVVCSAANGFEVGKQYSLYVVVTMATVVVRGPVAGISAFTIRTGSVDAVDVAKWLGTAAATPTVAGVPEVDVTHWNGTAVATPTTAGVPRVDVKAMEANVLTAAATAADFGTELADAIADEVYDTSAPANAQTLRQQINIQTSALTASGGDLDTDGTVTIRNTGDTKDRIVGTMSTGTRILTTLDGT